MKKTFLFSIVAFIISACSTGFVITDSPVSFSEKRIQLTKDYVSVHYGFEIDNIVIEPKVIVLHWTAIDDFDKCWDLFNRETLGNSRPKLGDSQQVNVGIQFLVAQNGDVHRLMPETWMARHVIGLNYNSIGVENVGGAKGIDNLTDEQIESNVNLIEYLVKKYPTIEYLIAHSEYTDFEDHELWLEKDPDYRTQKNDPSERFMNEVRRKIKHLCLKDSKSVTE